MNANADHVIHPKTRLELRRWLEEHHAQAEGVWLASYKVPSGKDRIGYAEMVDELLCFGWIDSRPNTIDEERSKWWIAPRRPTSGWSKINKAKIARLTVEDRMHPAGLEKVAEAKRNGSWTKLDGVENLELPSELLLEFEKYSAARTHFDAFPKSVKKNILEWIHNAKKTETRLKRVILTAELAEQNVRANQWRP